MQELRFSRALISVPERKVILTTESGQEIEIRFLERWAWFIELLAFVAKRMKDLPSRKVLWHDIEGEIEGLRKAARPLTIRANTTGPGLAASFHKFWAIHIHNENRRYFDLSPETLDKSTVTKSLFGVEHSNLYACYWLKVPAEQIDVSAEADIMAAPAPREEVIQPEPESEAEEPAGEGEKVVIGEKSMEANLDEILALLDEENIARAVSIKHDTVREKYTLEKSTVANYEEFLVEITKYYGHHFRKTIADAKLPVEIATQNALEIVTQAYASQGGLEAAYKNANIGTSGGLRAVIDSIYEALKREQEEKYINHVLTTQVNPLDWNEKTTLMRQYLTKFGRYLPAGTKARSPEQLANNYSDLIKLHIKVVGAMRSRLRM